MSSNYTTFLTPSGKYKYNQNPMECSASQDWWNKISDVMIIKFQKFSVKSFGNILVWAENLEQLPAWSKSS